MKPFALILSLVLCVTVLAACGGQPQSTPDIAESTPDIVSSAPVSTPQEEDTSMPSLIDTTVVYRGKVDTLSDESITVSQIEGYNYGQATIIFHLSEDTQIETDGLTMDVGAYVEITYNGILARSLPAQGTALTVTMISPISEGILQNGTIHSVTETDDGYTLSIMPFGVTDEDGNPVEEYDFSRSVTLHVAADALENLAPEDLVEGAQVSALTTGIAALSLPPQMSALKLMPYNWPADEAEA